MKACMRSIASAVLCLMILIVGCTIWMMSFVGHSSPTSPFDLVVGPVMMALAWIGISVSMMKLLAAANTLN